MSAELDAMPMTSPSPSDTEPIRPLRVVMICLVVMTVAGGLLLLSAARPMAPVDGAIEWHEGSVLRAVVEILCLNHQYPTDYAGAVKGYILGLGAGLALITIGVAVAVRPRTVDVEGVRGADEEPESGRGAVATSRVVHIAPLIAAQALVGLYLLWSFASSRWSQAADLAVGGSILLSIHFLWSACLGCGLNPSAARIATRIVLWLTVVTACIAIWYFYGRKPMRADFPVGNPSFLGACLIPGVLLAVAFASEQIGRLRAKSSVYPSTARLVLCALASGVLLWAIVLANSRAAYGALIIGALAIVFFGARGRRKWYPVVMTLLIGAGGWVYVSKNADSFSPTGRSASLRLRKYAWGFAWRMFLERPLQGHGQGGFVLEGDSHAASEVLDDPEVFGSRITHAHNEWAEVLADLGSVGFVLVVGALLLTLHASMAALAARPPPELRWPLLGLMGTLVALMAEESFSVGLRLPGVGTMFYTVIGLIWALSSYRMSGLVHHLASSWVRRTGTCVLGIGLGILIVVLSQQDFASAHYVYRATDASYRGDHESAIEWANRAAASTRLNPQRALTNLFRLSEMHLLTADSLQSRARDRNYRAMQSDPPNPRLVALAQADLLQSDIHCEHASAALKELVIRAPDFINQGRLGYWLNLIRASNALARGDQEQEKALWEEASRSIERELDRQPFSAGIAVDFVRSKLSALDSAQAIEVLARPLRYSRLSGTYLELLQKLALHEGFDAHIQMIIEPAAGARGRESTLRDGQSYESDRWLPEKLRLAASISFIRGEYKLARDLLLRAVEHYARLERRAATGWASCYGELAICQFFLSPTEPQSALASATEALALAPKSRTGRDLELAVKQRMIEFHLAAGDEDEAIGLLRENAPAGVDDAAVRQELGRRYARMCESLLGRREAGGVLRTPPAELTPALRRWVGRALTLAPVDSSVHYLAADLAFYAQDDEATVRHLRKALEHGTPADMVVEFLRLAMSQRPESKPLQALWREITRGDSGEDEAEKLTGDSPTTGTDPARSEAQHKSDSPGAPN